MTTAGQVVGQGVEQVVQRLRGRPRRVREDEVDRLADGEDLRGLLVGHLHAVGVLELLDERVEVQRVGLEILLEARRLVDARGIELELVGQVARISAKTSSRVMDGHASWPLADARGAALRRAPASASRVGPPDDVLAHAARGQQDRLRDPRRAEAPVGHDAEPAQAEQVGAARRLGVDRVAQIAQRRPQQQAAGLRARATTSPPRGSRAASSPRRPP